MKRKKVYIIGSGITGLSCGAKLAETGYEVAVFEKNTYIGGLAATFKKDNYSFDLGPHKIFSVMKDVLEDTKRLLGDELLTIRKKSRIRLRGKYLNYPVGIKDLLSGFGVIMMIKCMLSYLYAALSALFVKRQESSYRDWVINRFGGALYGLVFGPYAEKIWGAPETLDKSLAETRIAAPNPFKMAAELLFGIKDKTKVTNAEEFYYPEKGAASISEGFAERIKAAGGEICLNESLSLVKTDNKRICGLQFDSGKNVLLEAGDILISTIPLKFLKDRFQDLPPAVIHSIDSLKTKNLILHYIKLGKKSVMDDNWIFFPEKKYLFNRIFEQKNFSSHMVPGDFTLLCMEITCDKNSALWKQDENELFDAVIGQLEECGLAKKEEVLERFTIRLEEVYQIYDIGFQERKTAILSFLDSFDNFFSIGRHGDFNYSGMLDCIDMGQKTAGFIAAGQKDRQSLRKQFEGYVVVD